MIKEQPSKQQITEDEIDLSQLFHAVWRKKWFIACSIIIAMLIGISYTRVAERIYQADALIKVEKQSNMTSSLLNSLAGGIEPMAKGGEEAMVNSRLILGKTVDAFNLQTQLGRIIPWRIGSLFSRIENVPRSLIDINLSVPDDYYLTKPKQLVLSFQDKRHYTLSLDEKQLLKGLNGETTENQGFRLYVDFDASLVGRKFKLNQISRLQSINELSKRLSLNEVSKGSGFYKLVMTGKDPVYVEKLLDNITESFVSESQTTARQETQKSIDFINSQLPQLNQNLLQSEKALNHYMTTHDSVNLSVETESTIASLAAIESQLTELSLKENELSQTYTKDHPRYQAVLAQKRSLNKRKNEIVKRLKKTPNTQQGVVQLKRDVEVNQGVYMQLLMKLQELKVIVAANSGHVRIIDNAASTGEPIKPKSLLIIAVAGFLGALFGLGYALISHIAHKIITSVEDVVDHAGLSVIGTIPFSKKLLGFENKIKKSVIPLGSHSILSVSNPDDLAVEALRGVLTSLHFANSHKKNKTIMLTGPTEDVGKSFIASNIAVLFAEAGKKVILIDADFRKSYLHGIFSPEQGKQTIDELVHKDLDISAIIHSTSVPNLSVILQGEKSHKKYTNFFMSRRFEELITHLNESFDIVIIDTPPILPIVDSSMIARHAGSVILAVRAEQSTVKELEMSIARLENVGVTVDSVIINGIKKSLRYGSYYGYSKY